MVTFVDTKDIDFIEKLKRVRLAKNQSGGFTLFEKNEMNPVDQISYGFEKIIQDLCKSSNNRIAKKLIRKGVYRFREIDVLIENDATIIFGEIKLCLKGKNSKFLEGCRQLDSFVQFVGDFSKEVKSCVIFVKMDADNKSLISQLDLQNDFYELDAGILFDFGLKNNYFIDPKLLSLAVDGIRFSNEKKGGTASFGDQSKSTLGDFFDFSMIK